MLLWLPSWQWPGQAETSPAARGAARPRAPRGGPDRPCPCSPCPCHARPARGAARPRANCRATAPASACGEAFDQCRGSGSLAATQPFPHAALQLAAPQLCSSQPRSLAHHDVSPQHLATMSRHDVSPHLEAEGQRPHHPARTMGVDRNTAERLVGQVHAFTGLGSR